MAPSRRFHHLKHAIIERMLSLVILGFLLLLLVLGLALLYSPPSSWIGRNKDHTN
jgi:hypothetical protein